VDEVPRRAIRLCRQVGPKQPMEVKTAMIYTHVLNRGSKGVRSPMNVL
jgi:hypothetical protein